MTTTRRFTTTRFTTAAGKLSAQTRLQVAADQFWRCGDCHALLPPSFQIDHIIPKSLSFCNRRDNLQALCGKCHVHKTFDQMDLIRNHTISGETDTCPVCNIQLQKGVFKSGCLKRS